MEIERALRTSIPAKYYVYLLGIDGTIRKNRINVTESLTRLLIRRVLCEPRQDAIDFRDQLTRSARNMVRRVGIAIVRKPKADFLACFKCRNFVILGRIHCVIRNNLNVGNHSAINAHLYVILGRTFGLSTHHDIPGGINYIKIGNRNVQAVRVAIFVVTGSTIAGGLTQFEEEFYCSR